MGYVYGIKPLKFIWHNEWSDPEIEYYGKRCSYYIPMDSMVSEYDDFLEEQGIEPKTLNSREWDDGFEKFVKTNARMLKEYVLMAIGRSPYGC